MNKLEQLSLFPEPSKPAWEPKHWLETVRESLAYDIRRNGKKKWNHQEWLDLVLSYVRERNHTYASIIALDEPFYKMSTSTLAAFISHLTEKGILWKRDLYWRQPELLKWTRPIWPERADSNPVHNLSCGSCRLLLKLPLHRHKIVRSRPEDEVCTIDAPKTAFEHFFKTS